MPPLIVCTACRLPRVASAAAAIACHWQQLGGLGGVPFAIPALYPSSRPSKGSIPPAAHLMAPTGMPTAPNAAAHSAGQGPSILEAREGQASLLQQGQDQRFLHPADSQGVGHSQGLLAAGQGTGSLEPRER